MAQPNPPRPSIPRVRDEGWIVGKLLAHGPARYRHEPGQSMSYFMRLQTLETEQGARQRNHAVDQDARPIDGRAVVRESSAQQGGVREFWSQDLKRAIREAQSPVDIGKIVAAKVISREALEASSSAHAKGEVHYRNRWEVETPEFIARRARFAHVINENYQQARRDGIEGKEAVGLYLIHAGARLLAAERYVHPEDRETFLERVKTAVETSPERTALIAKAFERAKALNAKLHPTAASPPRPTHERSKQPFARE